MRRTASVLALALLAGFLTPSSTQDVPVGVATFASHAVHQETGVRPHNQAAAFVAHAQLPADVPPVASLPRPLRLLVSAAHRVHRTPDEFDHTSLRGRAPPLTSGS